MQPLPAAIQKCQVAPSCQRDNLAEILQWSNSKWKSSALSKQNCLKHLIRFQSKIDIFLFKLTYCKISPFCPGLSGWLCPVTNNGTSACYLCSGVGSIMETGRMHFVLSLSRNFMLTKTLVSHNAPLPAASCPIVSHLQLQDLLGEIK